MCDHRRTNVQPTSLMISTSHYQMTDCQLIGKDSNALYLYSVVTCLLMISTSHKQSFIKHAQFCRFLCFGLQQSLVIVHDLLYDIQWLSNYSKLVLCQQYHSLKITKDYHRPISFKFVPNRFFNLLKNLQSVARP